MVLSHAVSWPRRREVLKGLTMAAAWVGATQGLTAWAAQAGVALDPAAAAWRVLSRVGYGPTAQLTRQVTDLSSARDWALQQVDAAYAASQQPPQLPPELPGFNAPLPVLFEGARREREVIRQPDAETIDGSTGKAAAPMAPRRQFLGELGPRYFNLAMLQQSAAWRLYSATRPDIENPLLARMTEFWFNHLNVFAYKGPVRPFVGHYAIHVARARALGKFEDLLLASARHPAMLFYLDQFQSVAEGTRGRDGKARGLNENYARELMELHTLGVDGGYTQGDVRELARILTGWTVSPRDVDGFQFLPRLHDSGRKRLLGQDFPHDLLSTGAREGEDAIRLLARHPATARRISTRLAQYFVADDPPPALVQQLASTFLASQGDMRQVMRALLQSPDFWAPGNHLFKTPMDFALSGLIAVQDVEGDTAQAPLDRRRMAMTLAFLSDAGQALHSWQTPDGYRFDAATWMVPEALTRRADFALALARQTPEPRFLQPYLSTATRARIDEAPAALRSGLMLASPDFMFK
ncbi:MAG: DUF1800 domain-containing protein [Burkholderiaceae bacterium]